jgi:ribonuclease HII
MPAQRRAIAGVDDSKQLVARERERLADIIERRALAIGIGAASASEIDRVNIYNATVLAMQRALGRLGITPAEVLIDGRPMPRLAVPHRGVVGGDGKCFSIACASILAKVTRDRLMKRLAARYPQYRWETNSGYCTEAHVLALKEHGPTPHHRRSFLTWLKSGQYDMDLKYLVGKSDNSGGDTIQVVAAPECYPTLCTGSTSLL